jgi:AmmeMemoRadiSam system protein B
MRSQDREVEGPYMKREGTVRHPVVSGLFYPDKREELESSIQRYLERIDEKELAASITEQTGCDPLATRPLAAIVPHAGYIYSARVQAHAYGVLKRYELDTVIVVGPSHQNHFQGISVNTDTLYRTPLGDVPVNFEVADALLKSSPHFRMHEDAHLSEHAVEVQVPFIQTVFPGTAIVPVLFGDQNLESAVELYRGLGEVMDRIPGRYVVIASTDLSHYHSHVDASSLDLTLIEHIRNVDPEGLNAHIEEGRSEACGFAAILTALILSRERGLRKAAILSYTDSGEVSGNRSNVVGYLSALLY